MSLAIKCMIEDVHVSTSDIDPLPENSIFFNRKYGELTQLSSPLDVSQYKVYQFTTKQQCLSAERECKETLECEIVERSDMPDGYTETTYPYNVDSIIRIYEKHGGVEI